MTIGHANGIRSSRARRRFCRSSLDVLEDRQLLSASLQMIAPVTVPALQGFAVPLLANTGATDAQTYTVTSNNANIVASVAKGPFWTLNVSYTDPSNSSNDFTGALTFQLFQGLTPTTVSEISHLTTDGYFPNTGKYFSRIIPGYIVQGGAPNPDGSEPDPPVKFSNEPLQQLAYTGKYQLAMANAGGTATNESQFFVTLAPENSFLGYNYTIFGQLLTGISTITKMAAVPVVVNGQASQPVNPVTMSSATLASTNPNGTLLIDTTAARPGSTATITVTATDPSDDTKTSRSFVVTVGPYGGPTDAAQLGGLNFKPYVNPITTSVTQNTAHAILLSAQSTYPDTSVTEALSYSLYSRPSHGTISDFNAATGAFVYTPDHGYVGTDEFQYAATATIPNSGSAPATSAPATVTITIPAPPALVHVKNARLSTNSRKEVTQIVVTFSGGVNAQQASQIGIYRVVSPARNGSYTASGATVIKLRSAVYNSVKDTLTLTPKTPFGLPRRPIKLTIDGTPPLGLKDSYGRYIDGADDGKSGTSAVVLIKA
jgi:cyclophilin family peptidyl-prolyl cis-trans isomerase